MGFFDYVKDSIDNQKQIYEKARMDAVETNDPYDVLYMLKRTPEIDD